MSVETERNPRESILESVWVSEEKYTKGEMGATAFSSICYSFATEARAEGQEDLFRILLKRAEKVSDTLQNKKNTPSGAEVRATILRTAGRTEDALSLIEQTLAHDKKLLGPLLDHVEGLLLVGKAEILFAQDGSEKEIEIETIMNRVSALIPAVLNKQQAIRLYRGLVRYYKRKNNLEKMHEAEGLASALIKETNDISQEKKLAYDLKS